MQEFIEKKLRKLNLDIITNWNFEAWKFIILKVQ